MVIKKMDGNLLPAGVVHQLEESVLQDDRDGAAGTRHHHTNKVCITLTPITCFHLLALHSISFSTFNFRSQVHSKLPSLAFSQNPEEKLKTFRKFMFVRQPFERILSAYRDKLESVDELYDFHKEIGMKIEMKYR